MARSIRDTLCEDPDRDEFEASELASTLGISEMAARRCLEYLSDLGITHSGSTSGEGPGWGTVYVKSDQDLESFLNYTGIDDSLVNTLRGLSDGAARGPRERAGAPGNLPPEVTYRKNTAFIMMSMDPANAQLEDVANCFREVCSSFGIQAERADDVEHSGVITSLVLERIEQSEVLIADLTGERPNVYYEIGYAHALGKRPILYRARETQLHFDLSVYNVPEYRNVTHLRQLITARLEAITGRGQIRP